MNFLIILSILNSIIVITTVIYCIMKFKETNYRMLELLNILNCQSNVNSNVEKINEINISKDVKEKNESNQKQRSRQVSKCKGSNQKFDHHVEFSKLMIASVVVVFWIVSILGIYICLILDFGQYTVLCSFVAPTIMIAIGFYYWKAKNENCFLMKEGGHLMRENQDSNFRVDEIIEDTVSEVINPDNHIY